MKTNFVALLILSLIIVNAGCSSKKSGETDSTADTLKTENVKTAILKKEEIIRNIEYTSSLVAYEEVHLAPATAGRIKKYFVDVSDFVQQGQLLVQMDSTQYQQAQITMLSLETDFNRYDTLKKTGSIADQLYDQFKAKYDIAKSSFGFLLENTQLKAPFSGIISGKYFEDGEVYSGLPVAAVGKPAVLSIVQINNLKALVNVSSSYFPLVSLGMKADVISDLYPDITYKGVVTRIYPTIDNSTKTFVVELSIENEKLKLRPGMFAKIRINLGEGDAVLVPSITLIKQTGTNNMYVFINKDNKAIKKLVKTGTIIDDKTEIIEGLSEGDELIITGQNKLENNNPIKVIKSNE